MDEENVKTDDETITGSSPNDFLTDRPVSSQPYAPIPPKVDVYHDL